MSVRGLSPRRAGSFLAVMTILFVGVGLWPSGQFASMARIAMVVVYLLVLARGRWWLLGLTRREHELDGRLRRMTARVAEAHNEWTRAYRSGDPAETRLARTRAAATCTAVMSELDGIHEVGRDWATTVQLLRDYVAGLHAAASIVDGHVARVATAPGSDELRHLNERAMAAWRAAARIRGG